MVSFRNMANVFVTAWLILLFLVGSAFCDVTGLLTDVKVSRDQKRVVIRYEGEIGKHAAFVIERPYRLVIDFSSTSLGNTPRKIKVNGREIREIRLGQTPYRARVVLDYGSSPVPMFRIQRTDRAVLVLLGRSTVQRKGQGATGSVAKKHGISSLVKSKSVNTVIRRGSSPLEVKQAGIENELVYVELVDKNKGGKTYRLVVDCNLHDLQVRHVSLSDDTGILKKFDMAEHSVTNAGFGTTRSIAEKGSGHPGKIIRPPVKAKFHWGMPVVRVRRPRGDREEIPGPFKLEEFKLKVRKQET